MELRPVVECEGGDVRWGIRILMFWAFRNMGLKDIHQMNGLKVFFALCINGAAALYFVCANMVYWPDVILMAVGAVAGGWGGPGIARRLGDGTVRRSVIAVGLGIGRAYYRKTGH